MEIERTNVMLKSEKAQLVRNLVLLSLGRDIHCFLTPTPKPCSKNPSVVIHGSFCEGLREALSVTELLSI